MQRGAFARFKHLHIFKESDHRFQISDFESQITVLEVLMMREALDNQKGRQAKARRT
jgi:hypothetical protein